MVVVSGTTLRQRFTRVKNCETARLYLLLHGKNPRLLNGEQIAELHRVFGLDS
jgi:hypothetical protein